MAERIDFIEELLQQAQTAEAQRTIEVNRLRADQILATIGTLEGEMAAVNELCDKEIKLIEEYRANEMARVDKKRSWLVFNLEGFMRSSGEKTLNLPHGRLKLRKGKDRIAVVAMEQFLKVGQKLGLLKKVPESVAPDLQAILNHVKRTGDILPGIEVIPAEIKFSYSTNGGSTDDTE